MVELGASAKPTRRNWRRRGLLALLVLALAAHAFRRPLFFGNFGVVEPGRVFRSAQPRGGLASLIRQRRIGSVLNLRGGSPADPFYADEVRVTRDAGVDFYDFPMSATRRPSRAELLTLLDVFARCRFPLLIHCKSGADRTGLASALYLMSVRSETPERAARAFTLDHGHVPLLGPERLHEPIDEYAGWLRGRGLTHSPGRFRHWVEHDYEDDRPAGPTRAVRPGPRRDLAVMPRP